MMQQFWGELIAFIFQKATDEGMDNNSCFPCASVLVKSFLFRRQFHANLLSKIAACSSVRYFQDCGGRVSPMSDSGTAVGILTGSWTPQT